MFYGEGCDLGKVNRTPPDSLIRLGKYRVIPIPTLPSVLEEGYLIEEGGLAKFKKRYKRGVIFL